MQSSTRITCRSTSLIDRLSASVSSGILQHDVINVSVSDHQLSFRSFKMYTVDTYDDSLKEVNFLNCKSFDDANKAFSNLIQQIRTVIGNIAPCKTKRCKGNTQKWFDGKVLEDVNTRDKISERFKKSRPHIDKEFYRKAKCSALKLMTASRVFDDKLSECIEKSKELW